MKRSDIQIGLVLGSCTAIALLLIAAAYQLTKAPIEKTAQRHLHNNLSQLLVPDSYDNNPATDIIMVSDPALGSDEQQSVYIARRLGHPTGAVVSAIAPNGYNGAIRLLIGFDAAAGIVGVRVIHHQETPGLGDDIDEKRSSWIHSFDGLTNENMQPGDWEVKKNGGAFDQFTGATITPRAVIHAVQAATQWYQQNRDTLLTLTARQRNK